MARAPSWESRDIPFHTVTLPNSFGMVALNSFTNSSVKRWTNAARRNLASRTEQYSCDLWRNPQETQRGAWFGNDGRAKLLPTWTVPVRDNRSASLGR